ncbi:MAG TPA: hypothetical protein PKE29_13550, partial [Phycisphaerales bacterium]|nr:hypothetical protein [Phycisphaerales bacterium]
GRRLPPFSPAARRACSAPRRAARPSRRYAGTGTWATGTIAGHDFCALVFPVHALNRDWELGDSRISKLSLTEQGRSTRVAAFDRGWDLRPTTDIAKRIVDLLSAGLAETVFGK